MSSTVAATAEAPEADQVAIEQRGVLVVSNQALRHLAEGVLAATSTDVYHPRADVHAADETAIELSVAFGLQYPTAGLSSVLGDLRRLASTEISRLAGRPVRRLDLTVDEFVTRPQATPRRVI